MYERKDSDVFLIGVSFFLVAVSGCVLLTGMDSFFHRLLKTSTAATSHIVPLVEMDLKAYTDSETKRLESYGWVDQNREIARIPVQRAMEILSHETSDANSSVEAKFDPKPGNQIPLEAVFRDEKGEQFPLRKSFNRKPVILTMVYYGCPNLCTWVLNGLVTALQKLPMRLGADYNIISVSIDPRETQALARSKKNSYLARYGISEAAQPKEAAGWKFLTGTKDAIDGLAESVGFRYQYDEVSKQYSHPSGFVVLSTDGKVSRYFPGIRFDPPTLRQSLVDAKKNKISEIFDHISLLCAPYNPASGQVGVWVMRLIRTTGIACAFFISLTLGWMIRQELKA
jgi:protein SCO1/2